MQLKAILCKFGQICTTGSTPMQLEMILCKFRRICATGNALMLLETISCKFGQICVTGLLCSWERLCTSLDRSVRQETVQSQASQLFFSYKVS